MDQFPNAITPRHFAVLLIMREITELETRVAELARNADPTDLFRSQVRVWLMRAIEELRRGAEYLQTHEDGEDGP